MMNRPSDNYRVLSPSELSKLDQVIDARIPTFELMSISKRAALRSLLTEFDAHVQQVGADTSTDLTLRSLIYRGLYNALNHGIQWIHAYCPETSKKGISQPNVAALQVLNEAMRYNNLWTQMSLAFRGRNLIARSGENTFIVSSAHKENQDLETARSLMAAATYPVNAEEAANLPGFVADEVRRQITIEGVLNRRLNYSFPRKVYETVAQTMRDRRIYEFSMNPAWDLGGYTFAELDRVWSVLKELEAVHQLALQKLARPKDRAKLNLRIRTRHEWISEISDYSGISIEQTTLVFNDLVYNPALYIGSGKKAHVMYQPFIELGVDEIAQSNALVMMSVVEKCSWILTEILRPKIHGELKNLKEKYWIESEFNQYESERLKLFPAVKFKGGDIDLLIYDTVDDFALIAQLKWTTSMDNVSGVESDDRQYGIGVNQALRSLAWTEEHRRELATRLGLHPSAFEKTIFRPIVIAKETLPSGSFQGQEVPVVNETLFHWIMDKPHRATLCQLWEVAQKADYLPKEGIHYEMYEPDTIVWGELSFALQGVAYKALPTRWDPAVDIILPPPS